MLFSKRFTAADVLEAVKMALKKIDMDLLSMNLFAARNQRFSGILPASNTSTGLLRLYIADNCVEYDPSQPHGARVVHQFEYLEGPCDPECGPRVSKVVQHAVSFSLGNGFAVPIRNPFGGVGFVWMGGYDFQLPGRQNLLQLMARYVFALVQTLKGAIRHNFTLSGRGREILKTCPEFLKVSSASGVSLVNSSTAMTLRHGVRGFDTELANQNVALAWKVPNELYFTQLFIDEIEHLFACVVLGLTSVVVRNETRMLSGSFIRCRSLQPLGWKLHLARSSNWAPRRGKPSCLQAGNYQKGRSETE
jgi:hypothetical protein